MPEEEYVDVDGMNRAIDEFAYKEALARILGDAGESQILRSAVKPLNRFAPSANVGLGALPFATAAGLARASNVGKTALGELPATVAHAIARGAEEYGRGGTIGDIAQAVGLDVLGAGGKAVQKEFFRVPKELYDNRRLIKATGREAYRDYMGDND